MKKTIKEFFSFACLIFATLMIEDFFSKKIQFFWEKPGAPIGLMLFALSVFVLGIMLKESAEKK